MRLVTRSDFDGLVCGVLLKSIGLVDSFAFVHPRDLQAGLVAVTENDVLANVAYAPGCGMWFDHHSSELDRVGDIAVEGLAKVAPSCARVVWEYYGGNAKFPEHLNALLDAVDKVDSGMLSVDEVKNPSGWVLLGFMMDPRTGLQTQDSFAVSSYDLMLKLMDACATMPVEEILAMPGVTERVSWYFAQEKQFCAMLEKRAAQHGNVVVVDLREQDPVYTGNRFTLYALFPESNASIQVMWGFKKKQVVFAVGHSILNRTCKADIGKLMLRYGGGGHVRVGTCQVPVDKAGETLAALLSALKE